MVFSGSFQKEDKYYGWYLEKITSSFALQTSTIEENFKYSAMHNSKQISDVEIL